MAERFGQWGLALAGKAKGLDAGGWFDTEVGAGGDPKSISHEHTFDQDTADVEKLETTLVRLSEMVARRLREHLLFARTIQLKLRYSDFSTITRAKSLDHATAIDSEILTAILALFHENCDRNLKVRLLGVHTSGFEHVTGQMGLLDQTSERWTSAMTAVDRMRDRYGESAVALARGMNDKIRERVHENPVGLPGRGKKEKK